ncbi:MAG: SEC-C domain-containing protein [Spirochaetales bacterium]|nr:SEC-C domain-containing protein [Spirochaetales bacterium]
MKIGRNDPCPCGSGKKYKLCCLKIENSSPSTGMNAESIVNDLLANSGVSSLDEFDEKLQEYQKSIEQYPGGTNPSQTFMEHLDRPNLATNTINNIHQVLDGHEFSSKKEADFFLNNYMSQQNNRGIEDFLGISPSQMQRISQRDLEDIEDVVMLNRELTNKDVASVPIMQYLDYLLSLYKENCYTLELTAKGNYRPYLVKKFNAHFFADDKYLGKVDREDKSWALGLAHTILLDFMYIEDRSNKNSGKSRLKSAGVFLLTEDHRVDFYLDILEYLLYDLDWVDQLREDFKFEEFSQIQNSAVFSLYLLKKLAAKFTDRETIYDAYIKAFPDFDPTWDSEKPLLLIPIVYHLLLVENFCIPLGLVEQKECENTITEYVTEELFKTTKLFSKLFKWQVEKGDTIA